MRETGESNSPNTLRVGILKKLTFCHNEKKKKSHPHHRRICVTCKPEKQLIRDVSCTENCFY